ncbi:peptidoglycan-binding domain-containing protein, partial [Janibacter indicus]|uniref:peptidoglycan-binding domain-containing protein n=1 Tax=Janibacter indicus TaxID=857417 RepID=UPI003D9AB2BB
MSMFYAGRHRAPSTKTPHRAGASMVAVAAVSLGTAAATAPGASAAPSAVSAPAAASVSSATSATTFSGLVKRGHRGSLVKQVQRKVGVSADGVFGPMTQSAVKRYQKRNGLVADGIVGPRTGTKMGL